jgi:hypothetical protein
MAAASPAGDAHPGESALPDQLDLPQRLQTLELQAAIDAKRIAQLREQNQALEVAIDAEQACADEHAAALMCMQRTCDSFKNTCDNAVDAMKAQHAELVKEKAGLKVSAIITELVLERAVLQAANSILKEQVAVKEAQTASKLKDIQRAIAALHTLLPPRLPAMVFDNMWCTSACGADWEVDIDAATQKCAHVTASDGIWLTLRSAAPLRHPVLTNDAGARRQDQPQMSRIVIEAYDKIESCSLGFVPSHYVRAGAGVVAAGADVTPITGRAIRHYGGWFIDVRASSDGAVADANYSGWTVMQPSRGATADAELGTSSYATTTRVPPVPPGSAVEFLVNYAGTCRVAFYTPAAAPYAKMELRFVETEAIELYKIPARSVPTRIFSGDLYPAAETAYAGAIWRFTP